jgi:predicted amidohydrolase
VYEDIEIGFGIEVLEMHAARLAVLICEDLARVETLLEELYAYGVTHILAPVFSKETRPNHWEHVKAKDYGGAHGTTVLVANSLVLAHLNGAGGEVGAALAHTSSGSVVQTASRPEELIRYVLQEGKAPRPLDKAYRA